MRHSFLLFLNFVLSSPYKILVYNPKFGHSNAIFYGSIADILVDAGHNVTSLLPVIDPTVSDGTLKSKKIYVPQTAECEQMTKALTSGATRVDYFGIDNLSIRPFFYGTPYVDRFALQCKGTLEEPGLIDRLRAEQFDVMIAENFDMCGIGLSHLIKPKALITGAASTPMAWMFEEFGIPKAMSYHLNARNSHLDVNSIWSRLKNLYANAIQYQIFYTTRSLIEKLFKDKYGVNFPSLTEISSHAAYTIINSEPLVDFATPTLSRVIHVGGLGAREPMKVNKELDSILNLRSKSILISFGSIIESYKLKDEVKNNIIEAVSTFPKVTFIWKYEQPNDEFAKDALAKLPNLHFVKWVPQSDLLADPRLTAFITHSGMGSTQEMMVWGKPGLLIPCFADQPRNAAMMERSGLGKVFDKYDFAVSGKFTDTVAKLLNNQSYYQNAQRIASMIANKPFGAREQLIRTVEFAAEFGPSPALRPQSYDMSWMAYHNLDIIAVSIVFLLFSVFIFVKTIHIIRYASSKIKRE